MTLVLGLGSRSPAAESEAAPRQAPSPRAAFFLFCFPSSHSQRNKPLAPRRPRAPERGAAAPNPPHATRRLRPHLQGQGAGARRRPLRSSFTLACGAGSAVGDGEPPAVKVSTFLAISDCQQPSPVSFGGHGHSTVSAAASLRPRASCLRQDALPRRACTASNYTGRPPCSTGRAQHRPRHSPVCAYGLPLTIGEPCSAKLRLFLFLGSDLEDTPACSGRPPARRVPCPRNNPLWRQREHQHTALHEHELKITRSAFLATAPSAEPRPRENLPVSARPKALPFPLLPSSPLQTQPGIPGHDRAGAQCVHAARIMPTTCLGLCCPCQPRRDAHGMTRGRRRHVKTTAMLASTAHPRPTHLVHVCRAQASAFLLPSGLASPPATRSAPCRHEVAQSPHAGGRAHTRPPPKLPAASAPSLPVCTVHSTPRPRFRRLDRPNQGAPWVCSRTAAPSVFPSKAPLVRALTPLLPSALDRGDAANRRTACTNTSTADTANQCDAVAKRA